MKKLIFLIALLCSGLLYAQTTVTADITSNTTWTLAGSPYTITVNSIHVDSSATLTIDPGVEVLFNAGAGLFVSGHLVALGTITDSIKFIGTGPQFNRRNSVRFNGEVNLAYADVSNLGLGFSSSSRNSPPFPGPVGGAKASFNHIYFHDNDVGVSLNSKPGSMITVDSSLFERHKWGAVRGWYGDIKNSVFRENDIGISGMLHSSIENCEFEQNAYAISTFIPIQISDCYIHDNENGLGLNLGSSTFPSTILDNQIVDNKIGIWTYLDTGMYNNQLLQIANNQICNDSINYSARINPPAIASTILMNFSNNCWCQWDSLGVDSTINNPGNIPISFLPLDSSCLPSLVFPGDANHDQIANNLDILPIGIHFNQTGTTRPGASLTWVGQQAADWGTQQANGRDIKHADCDGNATINWADTLAINLNYGMTHTSWRGTASNHGAPLGFMMPTQNLHEGDTLTIPITLGNMDTLAIGMYGLAFSIQYDKMLVDSASVRVVYDNSWLGTKNTDMLTIDKDFYDLGKVDIGMVRNDQMSRTNFGKIADLIVVVSDDLAKRELPFILSFADIYAIDSAGNEIEITGKAGESAIEINTGFENPFASDFKLYPNPTRNTLVVANSAQSFETVRLISLLGQEIQVWKANNQHELTLSLAHIPPGIYFLQVDMKEKRAVLKVEVIK